MLWEKRVTTAWRVQDNTMTHSICTRQQDKWQYKQSWTISCLPILSLYALLYKCYRLLWMDVRAYVWVVVCVCENETVFFLWCWNIKKENAWGIPSHLTQNHKKNLVSRVHNRFVVILSLFARVCLPASCSTCLHSCCDGRGISRKLINWIIALLLQLFSGSLVFRGRCTALQHNFSI